MCVVTEKVKELRSRHFFIFKAKMKNETSPGRCIGGTTPFAARTSMQQMGKIPDQSLSCEGPTESIYRRTRSVAL
jgi:hypothetical protein